MKIIDKRTKKEEHWELGDWYETLSDFYEAKYPYWHKVNAKLVIE